MIDVELLTSSERAYRTLKAQIIRLELKPNSTISETKLATALGVSRTPIREALSRLSTEGLVDFKSRSTTLVAPIRTPSVLAAQFIREKLEVAVIEEASMIEDPKFMFAFRQSLEEQKFAIDTGDHALFIESDERMHQRFTEAIGRPEVWSVIAGSKKHMDRVRWLDVQNMDLGILLDDHKQLYEAIERHDKKAAKQTMEKHLQHVLEHIDNLKSQYPDYFETDALETKGN